MSDEQPRFGRAGDDRLDRAIDRAVRSMMHVDPRPGFRRRVLSRLEAPATRSIALPRGLAIAGAAAAIVMALVILNRRAEVPQPATAPAPVLASAPVAVPTPAVPAISKSDRGPDRTTQAAKQTAIRPLSRPTAVFGPAAGRVSSATIDTVEPLSSPPDRDAPAASTVDRSELSAVTPLQVPPLEVRPLQIAPLSPPK